MEQNNTPNYVSQLLMPRAESKSDRRAWSIPLLGVWVPFFTATNAAGESAIPSEVLGAPIRLQRNKDGTPKFSQNGRPVLRTAKELNDQIRLVRDNFTFGLMSYAENVRKNMPNEYKAQADAAANAGAPLLNKDAEAVAEYLEQLKEQQAEQVEQAARTTEAAREHRQPREDKELVAA